MPDDPHVSADYQTLLEYAEAGINLYIAEGSKKRYSVHEPVGLAKKVRPQHDDKESATEALNKIVESISILARNKRNS